MDTKYKKLDPEAKAPTRATEGSTCYDVYAIRDTLIKPWPVKVSTGLAFEVPQGYYMDIRPRAGMSLEGVMISNSPGTLDSDYRGELFIIMRTPTRIGSYMVKKGERIAQIKIEPSWPTEFIEVEELSYTKRGEGGIGSTGR